MITTIGTVDPDEGLNGQPGFYFIDRDETFGPFTISLSGVVLLTGELDREAQDFYEVTKSNRVAYVVIALACHSCRWWHMNREDTCPTVE